MPDPPNPFGDRLSVVELQALRRHDLFPLEGYELMESKLFARVPPTMRHSMAVTKLFKLLSEYFGFQFLLSNFSLQLDTQSLPRVDFAVLASSPPSLTQYGYVALEDIRLLIEVADITLFAEAGQKARLYAQANIADYWILDVLGQGLLVHRQPTKDGYSQITEYYNLSDVVSPLGVPDVRIVVGDLLTP